MEPIFFVLYFCFCVATDFPSKKCLAVYIFESENTLLSICLKILVVKVIFGFFVFMKSLVP